ncbi:sigma-70 family RNA polymerase sigma factor [bacterium]|nr:MAG: sigma-70 family RNA polymerase sigma factor [bacterium]
MVVLEADILLAREGDRRAFGRLVDRTRSLVCSVALAIVRDVEASEDVAQDVYLHAWRNLPTLRNPACFLSWLRGLTRNVAAQWLRRDQPVRRTRLDESLVATLGHPDRSLLEEAERQAIRDALGALHVDAREVLILFYREERSVKQVAELLEISESAVKKRLERARVALKEGLLFERTAPNAAFSAGILNALPSGEGALPPGEGSIGPIAAEPIGTLLEPTLGIVGFLTGYAMPWHGAGDDRERRGMLRLARIGTPVLVAATAWLLFDPLLGYLALVSALALLHWVVVPRIVAPRLAAELRADPAGAARLQRVRALATIRLVAGIAVGGAGVRWSTIQPHGTPPPTAPAAATTRGPNQTASGIEPPPGRNRGPAPQSPRPRPDFRE